jgi:hypothetical protein
MSNSLRMLQTRGAGMMPAVGVPCFVNVAVRKDASTAMLNKIDLRR